MNLAEAYALYLNNPDWDKQEYRVAVERAFAAGWWAKEEALRQTALPLGGGMDYTSADCRSIAPDDIYAIYPRKVARFEAIKAIHKAIKTIRERHPLVFREGDEMPWSGATDEVEFWLRSRVRQYATATATWPEAEKKFIPHPATWFNRGSYDDDPLEWVRGNPVQASQFGRSH